MKSKKLKPMISIVAAISLITLAAAGCQMRKNSSNEKRNSKGYQPFDIWVGWSGSSTDNNWQQKDYWKKKLGFDVHIEYIQGDMMTALNLKMNSGGFPDMAVFNVNNDVTAAMSKSGLVQEAGKYLKDSKYPNLSKIPKAVLNVAKSSDGKNWYIPSWYDENPSDPWTGWAPNSWWVNTDVLSKAGVEEADFNTLDGTEQALKKIATVKGVQPLGFIGQNYSIILNSFGVDTTGVRKVGNEFLQTVDDPNYKTGLKYISKLTREGLVDKEALTQKSELFKQKVTNGKYGVLSASMWDMNSTWESANKPSQSKGLYLKPIKGPLADGVSQIGTSTNIYPYAGVSTFISKSTKHLDSILAFLNWAQTPKADMQLEFASGPAGGENWEWKGKKYGEWDFKEPYKSARMSSDSAKVDKLKSGLDYQLTNYSKEWYPWWTHANDSSTPKGFSNTAKFSNEIAKFGGVQKIHNYDMVPAEKGGIWEKYSQIFSNLKAQYEDKLILAKTDKEFESIWADYRSQLEKQAHWSEMKKEWQTSYEEYVKQVGDF